ncbi:MAG: hypothetical protein PHP08_00810 [Candidatus Dojkabacteria bacterium]|nr:hypothetical protein [Candidatus Dojkabacteria bacterium]
MRGAKVQFIVVCPYYTCHYGDKNSPDFSCVNCDDSVIRKDTVVEIYDNENKECQETKNLYWNNDSI